MSSYMILLTRRQTSEAARLTEEMAGISHQSLEHIRVKVVFSTTPST